MVNLNNDNKSFDILTDKLENDFLHYHKCLIQAIETEDMPKLKACIVALDRIMINLVTRQDNVNYDNAYSDGINHIYSKYNLGFEFIKALSKIEFIQYQK